MRFGHKPSLVEKSECCVCANIKTLQVLQNNDIVFSEVQFIDYICNVYHIMDVISLHVRLRGDMTAFQQKSCQIFVLPVVLMLVRARLHLRAQSWSMISEGKRE